MSISRMLHIKHEIASPSPEANFSTARMREIFMRLSALSKGKKDKRANEFLMKEKKALREELKNNLVSVHQLYVKNKNYLFEYWLEDYSKMFSTPRKKDESAKVYLTARYAPFKDAWKQYQTVLASERKKIKAKKEETRETLGFSYKVTGGVFMEKGMVIGLQTPENQMIRIRRPKKPTKTQTNNYIGIELELIAKIGRDALNEVLCKNFLAGYVYVKDDGSIQKEQSTEFPHEITMLCRESDVKDVVTRLCKVLNSKEVGSYVNNSCGLHVHIDCRNRDVNKTYNNLVRTLPLLKTLVPKSRSESAHAERYCKLNKTSIFEEAQKQGDRYQAINPVSYKSYTTVEVRMHSGSTNAVKIVNWVKILCNAVNSEKTLTTAIGNVYEYNDMFGTDSKLTAYMLKRVDLFTGKMADAMDTRCDHYFHDYEATELAI